MSLCDRSSISMSSASSAGAEARSPRTSAASLFRSESFGVSEDDESGVSAGRPPKVQAEPRLTQAEHIGRCPSHLSLG